MSKQSSPKVIDTFDGTPNAFLSNFYPSEVRLGRHTCLSVEHGYQGAKTWNLEERAAIVSVTKKDGSPWPGEAKRLGRKCTMRPDWEEATAGSQDSALTKIAVMKYLIRQKFTIPELAIMLISTGDAELIEGNTWHDNFWGRCRCRGAFGNCPRITSAEGPEGLNWLGKVLMETRRELWVVYGRRNK